MTRSQRFLLLIAATWLGAGLLQAAAGPTASIYLGFLEAQRNGTGDITGLNGATGLAVSPDGRNVYAAGELDDALAVFHRDSASGALTFVETQKNVLVTVGPNTVDVLNGAHGVVVSPDGAHVYVASKDADALVVFSRDAVSGALTFVQAKLDSVGKVNGLDGAQGIAISPDGAHVYVAGRNDDAVAVFSRDAATGKLTFVEFQRDGSGVDGLLGAKGVAVSPDGAHVYVAGSLDNAVAVFARDAATGKLSFIEVQREGVNGVTGLSRARALTVSPDGMNLYVAGGYDDALVVFSRNPETGMLTSVQLLEDSVSGVDGLNGADAVAITPDGTHVLVAGSVDNAVAVFQRDTATGVLTYVEQMRNGVAGVEGLHQAEGVSVSSDGTTVYAAGYASQAVAVFHVRGCGDGVLDAGEQCDDGNRQDGDCCSSTCRFEPATTLCRPAAGPCDVAEFCTGASGSCPADQFEPSTFECRGALGPCDEAELCTGTDSACPADAFKPATVECRPAAGVCDVAETCTGTGPTCPADGKGTGVCRPAAGVCDVAESCDGVSDDCPADAKSTGVCRPAAGDCDVAEVCDGASNDCPADAFRPATVECRPAAGVCDVAETCTGTSATCPADAFKPATVECRPAAGVCDVAETCTGASATCPADRKSTAVCRPAAGNCDVEERCDGASDTCPADAFAPAGTACGADADPCLTASSCSDAGECQPGEPKAGFDAVLCAFDRHLDQGACSSQTMPPNVGSLFARARTLVTQADGAPAARKRKLLQQAGGLLKKAGKSVAKAARRKHAPLAPDCANAAQAMLSDALSRVVAAPR